jgi:hypothetical protein
MKMKRNLFVLIMIILCTGMIASGQARKKKQAASSRPAVTAKTVVGHTYAKHDLKVADPELAEAYDNGTFKLVIDVSVYFVTENELQFTMMADLESRVYSKQEMEQVKASMGINQMNEVEEQNYHIKNGVVYDSDTNRPIAVINKGGRSITLKDDLFNGNVLPMIE